MPTRLVSFAGSALAITYEGDPAAGIVDFLFRHIPAGAPAPPQAVFHLQTAASGSSIELYNDHQFIYANESVAAMAELLLSQTCHHLADRSQGGLMFHAAGLARHGQALILPGAMHAGKTTLAAWLLARGYTYLTDELVFVPAGAAACQGFPRPLNLKYLARPIWQPLADPAGRPGGVLSYPHNDLVQPELFNPGPVAAAADVRLVIFPRFRPDARFELAPLSSAQAGLALMECLVNARNLPDHGLAEITRLARQAPAYRLSYGSFEQVGDCIEQLWA